MNKRNKRKIWPALVTIVAVGLAGCDTDKLLEVNDPDLVTPGNVPAESSAELYWAGALGQFAGAFSSGGGGQVLYAGMLADEFHLSGTFPTRNEVDRREMDERNGTLLGEYRSLHQARVGTKNAADIFAEFRSGDPRTAELWNLNGFTYLLFAEHYCSGVPFGEASTQGELTQGTQTTTSEMLDIAIGRFQQAQSAAAGSVDQEYLAAIGLGRTHMNRGDYAAAAAAVASVPDDWEYLIRHKGGGAFGQRNAIYEMNFSQRRWSLSDMEGGNGVAFRSQEDSRVPWEDSGGTGFDEETQLFHQLKYTSWDDDVVLASGIEARLIRAENELDSGGPWLATLNALRAAEGLGPLVDPGSDDARVDMLFDERARWLFGTAHRLGDLRRLVRQYGRAQADVFPSGPFFKGGSYGPDVNFPVPFEESENPNVEPQSLCLNRDA
jgi:starch-binding outer membrane protein, SusD/RagB family